MATRSEILAQAREATETAPVSHVRYTDHSAFEYTARDLEQDQAYDSAIDALRSLRAKWAAENARQVAIRQALERAPVKRVACDDIVTSAPDTVWLDAEPIPLVRRAPEPIPLVRPVLKGKVAKRRRCVIPALRSFFQAASIFASA